MSGRFTGTRRCGKLSHRGGRHRRVVHDLGCRTLRWNIRWRWSGQHDFGIQDRARGPRRQVRCCVVPQHESCRERAGDEGQGDGPCSAAPEELNAAIPPACHSARRGRPLGRRSLAWIELIEQVADDARLVFVACDQRRNRIPEPIAIGGVPPLEELADRDMFVQADSEPFGAQQVEEVAERQDAHRPALIRPNAAGGYPVRSSPAHQAPAAD